MSVSQPLPNSTPDCGDGVDEVKSPQQSPRTINQMTPIKLGKKAERPLEANEEIVDYKFVTFEWLLKSFWNVVTPFWYEYTQIVF